MTEIENLDPDEIKKFNGMYDLAISSFAQKIGAKLEFN